jgi:tetratricopeptide (TPR) repeat protein
MSSTRLRILFLLLCFTCSAFPRLYGQSKPVALAKPAPSFDDVAKRAKDAWEAHQLEDAAKLYRQAVQIHPLWAEGWGYLASSLYQLKRYPEARDAYRHTTVLTPKNAPSWTLLGLCEYELRDYRHAFDHLFKAEQLGIGEDQSLQATVKYHLALLWVTAGQFELGMKELTWFADRNQANPDVIQATGLSLLRMALFPYEIPENKRELVMKAGAAGWATNTHHMDEAKALYEELVAAYPKEPNVHYAYGIFLVALDQEAAVAELEKELQITPAHVPALIEASFLCLKMGQLDKSAKLAARATEIEPKNYAPHNISGRILVENGETARGIQELEIAANLAPHIAETHFNLAQAYQRAGRKEAAAREFAIFEKLNKPNVQQDPGSAAGNP